jgi:ADP-ribosylglycohydrolase
VNDIKGRSERTVLSALWAAWGDALGFITELTDADGLRYRTGGHGHIETPIGWRRRLGGKFGTTNPIPAGMYSDDTQLRLATSRAIKADGGFDLFAFSKLELPVWPLYELGGGRGTKTAAENLAKRDKSWNANFFTGYDASGGNGAAMRIQPHVWAAKDPLDWGTLYSPVIRNSVCTHGHIRALLGATVHAATVGCALVHGRLTIDDVYRAIDSSQIVPDVVAGDRDLGRIWLPFWEDRTKTSFTHQCKEVQSELFRDLEILESIRHDDVGEAYYEAVRRLKLDDPACRGSGTLTALVAAWVCTRTKCLRETLVTCANTLGSDTDSIATMVGAIAGCCEASPPDGELIDREYITSEAIRLADISQGKSTTSFHYPSISSIRWPKRRGDAVVVLDEGRWAVLGLGGGDSGRQRPAEKASSSARQLLKMDYGQTLLISQPSRKAEPGDGVWGKEYSETAPAQPKAASPAMNDLFHPQQKERTLSARDIHRETDEVIRGGFDESAIGRLILSCADLNSDDDAILRAAAAASIIVKAVLARRGKIR